MGQMWDKFDEHWNKLTASLVPSKAAASSSKAAASSSSKTEVGAKSGGKGVEASGQAGPQAKKGEESSHKKQAKVRV